MKVKKIDALSIIAVIIIIGLIITFTIGLNFDLTFTSHKRFEISIGKDYNVKDIENIAKEAFGRAKNYSRRSRDIQ